MPAHAGIHKHRPVNMDAGVRRHDNESLVVQMAVWSIGVMERPAITPIPAIAVCAQNFSLSFSSFALSWVIASVGTVTEGGTDSAHSSRIFLARSRDSSAPVG